MTTIEKPDDNLMWVEKYRPETLSDLVAHEDITNTVQKLVKENKLPHLLFYGPPGTGKTSTILAIAKDLYGKNCTILTISHHRPKLRHGIERIG